MKWIKYTIEGNPKAVNGEHIARLWYQNAFTSKFAHHVVMRVRGEKDDRVLFYANTRAQAETVLEKIIEFLTISEMQVARLWEAMEDFSGVPEVVTEEGNLEPPSNSRQLEVL